MRPIASPRLWRELLSDALLLVQYACRPSTESADAVALIPVFQALSGCANAVSAGSSTTEHVRVAEELMSLLVPALRSRACLVAALGAFCRSVLSLAQLPVLIEACLERLFALSEIAPTTLLSGCEGCVYSLSLITDGSKEDGGGGDDSASLLWQGVLAVFRPPDLGWDDFLLSSQEQGCTLTLALCAMQRATSEGLETINNWVVRLRAASLLLEWVQRGTTRTCGVAHVNIVDEQTGGDWLQHPVHADWGAFPDADTSALQPAELKLLYAWRVSLALACGSRDPAVHALLTKLVQMSLSVASGIASGPQRNVVSLFVSSVFGIGAAPTSELRVLAQALALVLLAKSDVPFLSTTTLLDPGRICFKLGSGDREPAEVVSAAALEQFDRAVQVKPLLALATLRTVRHALDEHLVGPGGACQSALAFLDTVVRTLRPKAAWIA
jgi:hypothetical protein